MLQFPSSRKRFVIQRYGEVEEERRRRWTKLIRKALTISWRYTNFDEEGGGRAGKGLQTYMTQRTTDLSNLSLKHILRVVVGVIEEVAVKGRRRRWEEKRPLNGNHMRNQFERRMPCNCKERTKERMNRRVCTIPWLGNFPLGRTFCHRFHCRSGNTHRLHYYSRIPKCKNVKYCVDIGCYRITREA